MYNSCYYTIHICPNFIRTHIHISFYYKILLQNTIPQKWCSVVKYKVFVYFLYLYEIICMLCIHVFEHFMRPHIYFILLHNAIHKKWCSVVKWKVHVCILCICMRICVCYVYMCPILHSTSYVFHLTTQHHTQKVVFCSEMKSVCVYVCVYVCVWEHVYDMM